MKTRLDVLLPVLAGAVFLLVSGCVTTRTQFEAKGEELLASEDFTAGLYGWRIESQPYGAYEWVHGEEESYLRQFGESGGAYLVDSLVDDFRIEFQVRLELPKGAKDTWAMINFRNFFNKRYCLILQPDVIRLAAARVKHSQLETLASSRIPLTLNRWYRFEIATVGGNIKVFKDGLLVLDVTDKGEPIPSGNIWFENHARYSFANVTVWRIQDFVKVDKKEAPAKVAAKPAAVTRQVSVALTELDNLGVAANEASLLADLFSSSLLGSGAFRIVERKELRKVLEEMELQLSDLADPEEAVRLGHLLNAEYLSTGSFGMLGGEYMLNIKLIQVETGETVVSVNRSFRDPAEIPGGLSELVSEMARAVQGL